MSIPSRIPLLKRLRSLLHRDQLDSSLDAELQFHLEQKIQDLIDGGMTPRDARTAALRSFGGVEKIKEASRDTRGTRLFEDFVQDIRYALRTLRKSPGFTAVAVLTLALGIGANTAIFSAVNGILLDPLPYADSSRLVKIERRQIAYAVSASELREIQMQCTALEATATYNLNEVLISGDLRPERVWTVQVSGDFFPLLGVNPLLGRPILSQDTQPGDNRVAVLSYRFWMDSFGGDATAIGRHISVDQKPYVIIGVMPERFDLGFERAADLGIRGGIWVPPTTTWSDPLWAGPSGTVIARIKEGASLEKINAQLKSLSARFAPAYPSYAQRGNQLQLSARQLARPIDPTIRSTLLILFGAVGFVLLMACVNVTSLLVAKSWTRQQELAIRRTLGASHSRILRQLLSESLLLAIGGGGLGLLFSAWGIRLIRAIAPPFTPRLEFVRLDGTVLYFTVGISLLAAVLVGLTPALHATSRRVGGPLKGGLAGSFVGTRMRQSHLLRDALVILEVALAIVVVIGGALMSRSFYKLTRLETGIRADHVLTMSVHLSDLTCKSNDPATMCQLAEENVLNGIRSLPGIQQAALDNDQLINGGEITESRHYPGGDSRSGLYMEGLPGNLLSSGLIMCQTVTPDFFTALGIELLKGRDFDADDLTRFGVAIVSESFARKYVPGNPLGKRFSLSEDKEGQHAWIQIVGVVNDVRDRAVTHFVSGPVFYTPFWFGGKNWEIIARTPANPMSMVSAIVRVVRSVDPDAPIENIETVDQMIAQSAAQPRFQTALLASFGILGLVLAIIGTYGVISYSVAQRTHEIGVRIALGARPSDVLRLILGQGAVLAISGIAIGLAGALALTRLLRSFLFEITPTDPATFAGVVIALALAAFAACYIPARRAMRVDPVNALRCE